MTTPNQDAVTPAPAPTERLAQIWEEEHSAVVGQDVQEVADAQPSDVSPADANEEGAQAAPAVEGEDSPVEPSELSDEEIEAAEADSDAPTKKLGRWQMQKQKLREDKAQADALAAVNAEQSTELEKAKGHLAFFLEDRKLLEQQNQQLQEKLKEYGFEPSAEDQELSQLRLQKQRSEIDAKLKADEQARAKARGDQAVVNKLSEELTAAAEKSGLEKEVILAHAVAKGLNNFDDAVAALKSLRKPAELSAAEKQVLANAKTPAGVSTIRGVDAAASYKPGSIEHMIAVAQKDGLS